MSGDDLFHIPANPIVNSKGINDARMANQDLSVRGRATAQRFVIPPPPVDVEVKIEPVQRRVFVNPNAIGGRPVRRND